MKSRSKKRREMINQAGRPCITTSLRVPEELHARLKRRCMRHGDWTRAWLLAMEAWIDRNE